MWLLERERECAAAQALVDGVVAGTGGLLVIEGPSGIGKSVLLAELTEQARHAGVTVFSAHATLLGGGISFGLARWLLEPAIRATPSALETGWAQHARPLFEGGTGQTGERRLLVEGLVALVAELRGTVGPLGLVVDDAQFADPASIEFFEELAARCEDIGVAVAIALDSAPTDLAGASLRGLTAMAGRRLLRPRPFTLPAVSELVAERLPKADEAFAARVAETTGGNPFLVYGLIDSAERSGTEDLQIAEGVSRAVLQRLEGSSQQARALAEAVAVLGAAPLRLAGPLAGLARRDADRAADELVARNVISPGEPIRFAQPVLGDALSAALGPFERAARHLRAAQLLADEHADPDGIAVHLLRSRPGSEPWVCATLRRAARTALGRGDPAAAAELLERALAEPPEPADRGVLVLELAGARAVAGQPEAIETFEQALADVQDPERRAEAWRGLSRLLYANGDLVRAATAGARGRAELPEGHPLAERLLAAELTAASVAPELVLGAIERLDQLALGAPPSEPTLLALIATHQAARVTRIEQVVVLTRRAVAADPLIDPESRGIPLSHLSGALNWLDETVLAEQMLDAALVRSIELGDPLAEVNVRVTRAWSRICKGQLDLADDDLSAILAAGRLEWRSVDALCAMPLIVLRLERGDLAGARDALDRAPRGAQIGQGWFDGVVALAEGDTARALSSFEAAGNELEGILGIRNPGVLPWRSSAALAAWQLGQLDRARSLVAIELEQAYAVPCRRALGIALRVAGLVGEDSAQLDESVAVLEESPALLELARSLLFAGIVQRRAGRAPAARATLSRALELASECGAFALVEHARTELRMAGARPRQRPHTGPAALTPSERRTAELAASGRTTKQIAASLFLSPKTVEGQLTSVFRKLGISSRSELAPHLAASDEADRAS
jgi:DNA-binding CsgD family transcriptional regulator